MRTFVILSLFVLMQIFLVTSVKVRKKRSLLNLAKMVDCTHGVKSLLSSYGHRRYTDYGCYCGRGGSGDPIDDIDKCCFDHDMCYHKWRETHQQQIFSAFISSHYEYKCLNNEVICPFQKHIKKSLCECDAQVANCLKKHEDKWNERFVKVFTRGMCFQGNSAIFKN